MYKTDIKRLILKAIFCINQKLLYNLKCNVGKYLIINFSMN